MKKTRVQNRILRRLTAFLTAAAATLAFLLAALPTVSAQTTVPIYDEETRLSYIIDVDRTTNKITALIAGYKPESGSDSGTINIPEKITKAQYEVSGIANNAFSGVDVRDIITSVKLPKTVTSIGDGAFEGCSKLKTIELSTTSVTKIGSRAFLGCTSATEVKFPDTLTEIGYSAFYDCLKLAKAELPKKSLTYIGQSAFSGCTSLTEMVIPDTVTSIGSSAFNGCTSLVTVTLPSGLQNIEDYTFYSCSSLMVAPIPKTVKSIGSCAFSGCSKLNSIEIPESVQSIGSLAFSSCSTLSAVIIPHTLENISANAFLNTSAEIWGYYGSYAYKYANEIARLRFHAMGSVVTVTFSADNRDVTVNNIAITSEKDKLIIPPASVVTGDVLTINVTAPNGYDINYITINNLTFSNGSKYTVAEEDVNIFVSYKTREAATTSSATTPAPSTTSGSTSKASTTSTIPTTPSDDDTTQTTDDGTNVDAYVKVDSDLEDINSQKVRIITQKTNFIGPATVRITNTEEATQSAAAVSRTLNIPNAMYYAFDVSLFDKSGKENAGILAKGTVTIQMPVPNELLPYADSIKVYHIPDEDSPEFIRSTIIEDINGVKRVQFETNSFSPYMLIASTSDDEETVNIVEGDDEPESTDTTRPVSDDEEENGAAGGVVIPGDDDNGSNDAQIVDDKPSKPSNNGTAYNGNINPHTGVIVAGVVLAVIFLICIPLVRSRGKKRKRAKSAVE